MSASATSARIPRNSSISIRRSLRGKGVPRAVDARGGEATPARPQPPGLCGNQPVGYGFVEGHRRFRRPWRALPLGDTWIPARNALSPPGRKPAHRRGWRLHLHGRSHIFTQLFGGGGVCWSPRTVRMGSRPSVVRGCGSQELLCKVKILQKSPDSRRNAIGFYF